MTWRFAVEEFGWKTKWSSQTGLEISIDGSNTVKRIYTSTEIRELSMSLVKIETELFGGINSSGSGVFYNGDGGIATSYHVIENAETLRIIYDDGNIYSGDVVIKGYSEDADIVLLDTDIADNSYLSFGDSNDAKIGNTVYAIGSSNGLTKTISDGKIVAIRTEGLQISSSISPDGSGGVLLNQYDEVIGLTYLGYIDGKKIGIATPINNAKSVKENKELSLMDFYLERSFLLNIPDINYEIVHYDNGTYIGEIKNGMRHGRGAYHYDNRDVYVGEWYEDQTHGWGIHKRGNGTVYKGYSYNNVYSGLGEMTWKAGGNYYGYWQSGDFHGVGILKYTSGEVYVGNFMHGYQHGYGKLIWADGSEYRGYWINGARNGFGIKTFANGEILSGTWKDGGYIGPASPPITENNHVKKSYVFPIFSGIKYGNLYELSNGQIWRQTSYEKKLIDGVLPSVEINYGGSNYKMKFDIIEDVISVERLF
jgi:hypothetical protein